MHGACSAPAKGNPPCCSSLTKPKTGMWTGQRSPPSWTAPQIFAAREDPNGFRWPPPGPPSCCFLPPCSLLSPLPLPALIAPLSRLLPARLLRGFSPSCLPPSLARIHRVPIPIPKVSPEPPPLSSPPPPISPSALPPSLIAAPSPPMPPHASLLASVVPADILTRRAPGGAREDGGRA